jgi:hypothetical protein
LDELSLQNFGALNAELDVAADQLYYSDPNRVMEPEEPEAPSAVDYIRAMQKRRDVQIRYAQAVKGIDLLALICSGCPPFPFRAVFLMTGFRSGCN